jgi:hypothetical protein
LYVTAPSVLTSAHVSPPSVENSITPPSKLRLFTESRSNENRLDQVRTGVPAAGTARNGDCSSEVVAELGDRAR